MTTQPSSIVLYRSEWSEKWSEKFNMFDLSEFYELWHWTKRGTHHKQSNTVKLFSFMMQNNQNCSLCLNSDVAFISSESIIWVKICFAQRVSGLSPSKYNCVTVRVTAGERSGDTMTSDLCRLLLSRICSVNRKVTWMKSWTTGSSRWIRLIRSA